MALTALKINNKNIVAITDQNDGYLVISVYDADDIFRPLGNPDRYESIDSEQVWHTALRIGASKKGHYVKEYSTNPEWNSDYKEESNADTL
jgi:hypothetical protein